MFLILKLKIINVFAAFLFHGDYKLDNDVCDFSGLSRYVLKNAERFGTFLQMQ